MQLKASIPFFFLENLKRAIEWIFTCAFSMYMLPLVEEDLVVIHGVIPNIYKQDS
jgi:hypothetical protein